MGRPVIEGGNGLKVMAVGTPGASALARIGLATFGILALELALIRWMSGQIRIFAYFNNLILIGAFLGMGLGLALGQRRPRLHEWTLPGLLALSVPLAFSERLHLMHIQFPDAAISLWGADRALRPLFDAMSLLAFLGLFVSLVGVFVLAGSALGALFGQAGALRAYSADLLGSLLGVVVFTAATTLDAGPPVWFLVAGVPFAVLSRRWWSWAALAGVLTLAWHSAAGAYFSPYNRIDLEPMGSGYVLAVNRDFHQFMHDNSDANLLDPRSSDSERRSAFRRRLVYDAPFVVNPVRARALVVGAGTGNDVQAALRQGYGEVVSVDIDGRIIDLGRQFHPERPYDDPRAVPVVNDARAFFEQYRGAPFDAICYGLLDSHAMFSALSSLRLDNYVYTEEGIRAAWRHVSDRGHLSVSFSVFAGPWLADRLYWTIARATGFRPVMLYHGMHSGAMYLVARPSATLDVAPLASFERVTPTRSLDAVRTTSDDWPFLYIRPGVFPWAYLGVLSTVLALAFVSARRVFGARAVGTEFDALLFLVGAGFLLIETRGVTTLSLLFGSTWMVNAAVFAGILLVALVANLYVTRFGAPPLDICFVLLFASVAVLWVVDNSVLNRFDLPLRGVFGGVVNALPVGFAGVIVSTLLARSPNPTASLASNLLGSVVGGCLEYLSMVIGLRALALLALAIYLGAFFVLRRRGVTASVAWSAETAS